MNEILNIKINDKKELIIILTEPDSVVIKITDKELDIHMDFENTILLCTIEEKEIEIKL